MSHGEASSSSNSNGQRQSQAIDDQGDQEPNSSVEQPGSSGKGDQQEDNLARCPICQFIEAGECKEPHQVRWSERAAKDASPGDNKGGEQDV